MGGRRLISPFCRTTTANSSHVMSHRSPPEGFGSEGGDLGRAKASAKPLPGGRGLNLGSDRMVRIRSGQEDVG